jgi:hypothetical protein
MIPSAFSGHIIQQGALIDLLFCLYALKTKQRGGSELYYVFNFEA